MSDFSSSFRYLIADPQFLTDSNTISLSYFRRSDAYAILFPFNVTALNTNSLSFLTNSDSFENWSGCSLILKRACTYSSWDTRIYKFYMFLVTTFKFINNECRRGVWCWFQGNSLVAGTNLQIHRCYRFQARAIRLVAISETVSQF